MRLFFALLPDSNTREQLASAATQLTLEEDARLIAPENYHLTLAFIGEVEDTDAANYCAIGAAMRVPREMVELNAVEFWRPSGTVVLAAKKNPQALESVVSRLRAEVESHLPAHRRELPWHAHATLARKVTQARVLSAISVRWVSHSFALMRSVRGGGRGVYTVVDNWSLLDAQ